jgi:hypothetical protein
LTIASYFDKSKKLKALNLSGLFYFAMGTHPSLMNLKLLQYLPLFSASMAIQNSLTFWQADGLGLSFK